MNAFRSSFRAAACAIAIGVVAGCGAPASQGNPVLPGSGADTRACNISPLPWIRSHRIFACRADRRPSAMAQGLSSTTLLYVSDIGAEEVDVFSYPDGKLQGHLSGFDEPNGLCSDAKGNVFVADTYNSRIVEYAHGGTKPIAVIGDAGTPLGCAVDPTTGNLAVTNYNFLATGAVAVYKKARGTPTVYTGLWITYFCTYDSAGNLFIDGFSSSGAVAIGELAKGASSLNGIPLNIKAGWAGGLQWDGKHLVLGDDYANKFIPSEPYTTVAYKLSIQGGVADVIKTIPLVTASDIVQFSLKGKTLLGPDASNETVGFWTYPTGGKPTKSISGFYEPVGTALSVAP